MSRILPADVPAWPKHVGRILNDSSYFTAYCVVSCPACRHINIAPHCVPE